MTYSVKEIFYTLQGEGAQAGMPAVFCRFAGCNLWTGRESERASAICQFCDTDFVGTDGTHGGKFSIAQELAERIEALWPAAHRANRLTVLTGGEPLLQLDTALIDALAAEPANPQNQRHPLTCQVECTIAAIAPPRLACRAWRRCARPAKKSPC
jgi:7-carboxy-7-deazaguanine synthase